MNQSSAVPGVIGRIPEGSRKTPRQRRSAPVSIGPERFRFPGSSHHLPDLNDGLPCSLPSQNLLAPEEFAQAGPHGIRSKTRSFSILPNWSSRLNLPSASLNSRVNTCRLRDAQICAPIHRPPVLNTNCLNSQATDSAPDKFSPRSKLLKEISGYEQDASESVAS